MAGGWLVVVSLNIPGEYLYMSCVSRTGQTPRSGWSGYTPQSVVGGHTDNIMSSRQYLETSFWNEETTESDDEGIGSDESVDQADGQCNCGVGQPVPATREMSQQTVKSSLSVTKFLRVLKQSVTRDSGLRSPAQAPSLVFGLDLATHLSACRASVPDVVRRVRLSNFVRAARY